MSVVDGSVGLDEDSSDPEHGQNLVVEYRGGIQIVGADSDVAREAADLVGVAATCLLWVMSAISVLPYIVAADALPSASKRQRAVSNRRLVDIGRVDGRPAPRENERHPLTQMSALGSRVAALPPSRGFLSLSPATAADAMLNYLWRQPAFGLWLTAVQKGHPMSKDKTAHAASVAGAASQPLNNSICGSTSSKT